MFVKAGSPLKSIEEMSGKKIGVTLETTFETWLRENIKDVDIRTYKGDAGLSCRRRCGAIFRPLATILSSWKHRSMC